MPRDQIRAEEEEEREVVIQRMLLNAVRSDSTKRNAASVRFPPQTIANPTSRELSLHKLKCEAKTKGTSTSHTANEVENNAQNSWPLKIKNQK